MEAQSRRAPILAAGAAIALGAGLMAYRWFILGWSWQGDRSTMMLVIAVAAIVGGGQLMRAYTKRSPQPVWWQRVAVGVPALAAGLALGFALQPTLGHLRLHERDLHGLTLALPDGTEEVDGNELAGKVLIKRAGGFEVLVGVAWSPGTYDEAELKAGVAVLTSALGGRAELIEKDDFVVGTGDTHRSASMSKDGTPGLLTMFGCGPRTFTLFSIGDGSESLHRRILASVRCHEQSADAIGEVPATVDLPAGWKAQAGEPGQLSFASDDAALIIQQVINADEAGVEKVLSALGNAMGGTLTIGARRMDRGRPTWSGTLTVDKETTAVVLSTWPCPDRGIRLLAMYLHWPGSDEAPGLELISHARCKEKGTP